MEHFLYFFSSQLLELFNLRHCNHSLQNPKRLFTTGSGASTATTGMYTVHGSLTSGAQSVDPVSGRVELLDPDDKTMLRDTLIAEDGAFVFENVRKGSYVARVKPKSYANAHPSNTSRSQHRYW